MCTCAPYKDVASCNYPYVVHTASLVGQIWVVAFWEPWLCAKCGVGERWSAPPPKSRGPPWPSKKHIKRDLCLYTCCIVAIPPRHCVSLPYIMYPLLCTIARTSDIQPLLCVFWRAMVARMILVEERSSAHPRHISRTTMAPKTPPPIFDQPNSLCERHMGCYNLHW